MVSETFLSLVRNLCSVDPESFRLHGWMLQVRAQQGERLGSSQRVPLAGVGGTFDTNLAEPQWRPVRLPL